MTAPKLESTQQSAIQQACGRIAPTWPLDQMIAVNPWWELRDQSFSDTSAKLAALGNVRCLMSKKQYRELWQEQIQPRHLEQAADLLGLHASVEDLLEHLLIPEWQKHWENFSDVLDSQRDRSHRFAWYDEITHQVSQFCASFFQLGGPFNADAKAEEGLYRDWLETTRQDRGLEILMGERDLRAQFVALPEDRESLFSEAFAELVVIPSHLPDYLHALLLDMNGWASWIAYGRWQARLAGRDDKGLLEELLAVRLAWELVLWRHSAAKVTVSTQALNTQWQQQWHRLPRLVAAHRNAQQFSWVWQRAAELSYQEALHHKLSLAQAPVEPSSLALQAVFCIDVRSEPMRRALESQSPGIQTLGFAGFFGLPLEYQPAGTNWHRPQLPGLLNPSICVTEGGGNPAAVPGGARKSRLARTAGWQALNNASPATFSLVEATGLAYAFKLLKDSFAPKVEQSPVEDLSRCEQWTLSRNEKALATKEKAELVAGVLRGMGLTKDFAPLVLFVGHGSKSRNNPHAAGLDCGACGGQTGEINARVLAQLLNDMAVREALAGMGISIPESTQFQAALHNTTTEEIECLGARPSAMLQSWLHAATSAVRQERAAKSNFAAASNTPQLADVFHYRSRDWSQTRPEWGLANNAAFIVAPRRNTRGVNLEGRSFLHDYDWQHDQSFEVLESIMTAPMVVTHWINMQYNASSTDNVKYGSGNKVLHNVVGGNLGVFEGNGGDLRIGLSLQSLHDGQRWMHQALRLSVYIAAPRHAIADIVARHAMLSQLIDNDWLHLFQWDPEGRSFAQYHCSNWREIDDIVPIGTLCESGLVHAEKFNIEEREYA